MGLVCYLDVTMFSGSSGACVQVLMLMLMLMLNTAYANKPEFTPTTALMPGAIRTPRRACQAGTLTG